MTDSLRPLAALALLLVVPACAGTMSIPSAVQGNAPWSVVGYREHAMRERDFSIEGGSVHDIARSNPEAQMAARSIRPNTTTTRSYRFVLDIDGRSFRAACTDERVPLNQPTVGFGKFERRLGCTCHEGDQARVELSVQGDTGSLRLGDGATFRVSALHETDRGKTRSEALGYLVANEFGAGALDREGDGRAWAPSSIVPLRAEELRCAYAALFLFRP